MYYSALRRQIQSLEEKIFYDVAIMYLSKRGYRDLCIVDGPGDGGRDVTCSRADIRIQLSVRSDWENKINEEVINTNTQGKKHFIYVTNRFISPRAEEVFKNDKLLLGGDIDVSIHDLNRISTALSQQGVIRSAYKMLGMEIDPVLTVTPKEVAISTVLLFGREAKELRENVIEAHVKAWLLKTSGSSEDQIIAVLSEALPGADSTRLVRSAISRLRTQASISGSPEKIRLSESETERMQAAEDEYNFSIQSDLKEIQKVTGLSSEKAQELLNRALDLIALQRGFNGSGPAEEDLRRFIAELGLSRRRNVIYECLAGTFTARKFQYGNTIDQIFRANTFDIYRALEGRTDLSVVLDTSVALPLIFGLEFGSSRSRFGVAADALQRICKAHNIKMLVPLEYLNEMAFHGLKALDLQSFHSSLPAEAQAALRGSRNAYVSHFSHIVEALKAQKITLTFGEFLKHFGIYPGRSVSKIEIRIRSILEKHGLAVGSEGRYDRKIRDEIARRKHHDDKVIIEHDAAVATMLIENVDKGYILATWDTVLIEAVEELGRIYADSPARIIDFLSMVEGADYESDQSIELKAALVHVDESAMERLARQIEKIENAEQAFLLQRYIDSARRKHGGSWSLGVEEMSRFLDDEEVKNAAENRAEFQAGGSTSTGKSENDA